jgi:hypothetical protein
MGTELPASSREQALHSLYEAAELEHNLMCTYLYAAFSLRDGDAEGLSTAEAAAVARWRRAMVDISVQEMGHLTAVWNITSALGGSPRFGRGNFPLDPGGLPANVVVKLAPFSEAVLQHFIYLERPADSNEPDGEGFAPEFLFKRARPNRLTPMGLDYDTVGDFYQTLERRTRLFVNKHGESGAFCGDPALQLSTAEIDLGGAKPVICSKTALAAFASIIEQGEGAPLNTVGSHSVSSSQFARSSRHCARQTRASSPRFRQLRTLSSARRCGRRAACGSRTRTPRSPWTSRTPATR